jgi:hypothetical protein
MLPKALRANRGLFVLLDGCLLRPDGLPVALSGVEGSSAPDILDISDSPE